MTIAQRRILFVAVAAAALVAAHLLDPWAATSLRWPAANDRDWGRMLRILGFAPTWLLIALGFWLESRGSPPDRAAAFRGVAAGIALAVLAGGLGSEVLKLLFRRLRPGDEIGYVFRALADRPFSSSGFGMPSGHTAVAFAGAAALAHRYPRLAPLLYLLAAGCGLTRVFAHAHFLSDVTAGAIWGRIVGGAVAARFASPRAVR